MLCVPLPTTLGVYVVVHVAVPFDPANVHGLGENEPVPLEVQVTVPVGVPAPGETGVTTAVKVTDSPDTVGVLLVETLVVVDALSTTWVISGLVLERKLPSPPYTAVIV